MLENWVYEKAILERLSKHFTTGATLPDDIRRNLVATRTSYEMMNLDLYDLDFDTGRYLLLSSFDGIGDRCAAILQSRQLHFGFFDMAIHTAKGAVKTGELYNKLRKEIAGVSSTLPPIPSHPPLSFSPPYSSPKTRSLIASSLL